MPPILALVSSRSKRRMALASPPKATTVRMAISDSSATVDLGMGGDFSDEVGDSGWFWGVHFENIPEIASFFGMQPAKSGKLGGKNEPR